MQSLVWLIAFVSFAASASVMDGKSAVRDPGTSYLEYMHQAALIRKALPPTGTDGTEVGVQDAAKPYIAGTVAAATAWDSVNTVVERFQKLRDIRWMTTDDHPGFLRRESWMYPDDGCFARAALAVMNLVKWKAAAPKKVFVFGNLVVKTPNAPGGLVSWWYHVAPIVEVSGQKYVLDPAISPTQPLKLEDWLPTMTSDVSSLQVAVCDSGSYTPDDDCHKETDGVEATAASDETSYLDSEWSRLLELNRDPNQELGANPPWLSMPKTSASAILAP